MPGSFLSSTVWSQSSRSTIKTKRDELFFEGIPSFRLSAGDIVLQGLHEKIIRETH